MQEKRNLNNGLMIVSRWQLLLLRMQRFFWLLPALAAMCGLVAAGWFMLSAVVSWEPLAIFLWLWCGVVALAYARYCICRFAGYRGELAD
ncbi:hypothetical protein PsAD46_03553 [Pseudovibrio sp. Ad46]|uniref:hypothetical protein n=1 Tax=Pseudovibrio sp. Ad46 TaxID=989432 RepID=UPI0007AEB2F7|nr:hypothetical protein [Pseudovibrio sp. Ad46]KZK82425.1 hypothetical protein PsAD46_03553 [Pseudovibrio sp. Ad46]